MISRIKALLGRGPQRLDPSARARRSFNSQLSAWWRDAEAAADAAAIDRETVNRLRATMPPATRLDDDAERQEELMDGLDRLLPLSEGALPVLATQHRVIGTDACHAVLPASLASQTEAPGKLFVTSHRIVFAGAKVLAWPWHRVGRLVRLERGLAITVAGQPEAVYIICNTYGDAMVASRIGTLLMNHNRQSQITNHQ